MEELNTCERLSLARFFSKDNLGICAPTVLISFVVIVMGALLVSGQYDPESISEAIWDEPFFDGIVPNNTAAFICEDYDLNDFIRQPVAAMGAVSYGIVGILILGFAIYDWIRRTSVELLGRKTSIPDEEEDTAPVLLLRQPIWSLLLALHLIFVSASGVLYHASLTKKAWFLNDFSWWMTDIYITVYSIARLVSDGMTSQQRTNLCCQFTGITCVVECAPGARRLGAFVFFLGCMFVTVCADLAMWFYINQLKADFKGIEVAGYVVLGLMFFLPIWGHWYLRRKTVDMAWPILVTAVLIISLGGAIRWFDSEKEFLCDPTLPVQGFAAWQFLSATSLLLVYLFFRGDIWRGELLWLSDDVELISVDQNRISFRDSTGRVATLRSRSVSTSRQTSLPRDIVGFGGSSVGDGRTSRTSRDYANDSDSVTSLERRAMEVIDPGLVRATRNMPSGRQSAGAASHGLAAAPGGMVAPGTRQSVPRDSRRSSVRSGGNNGRSSVRSGGNNGRNSVRSGGNNGRNSVRSASGTSNSRTSDRDINDRLEELRRQRQELEERNRQVSQNIREKERLYQMADLEVPPSVAARAATTRPLSTPRNQNTVAMWTCSNCRHPDNELAAIACTACGYSRPPLSSMIAVARPVDDDTSEYSASQGGNGTSFTFRERGNSRFEE